MAKAKKSTKLKKPMTFSARTVIIFALIFGVVGGYAIWKTSALSQGGKQVYTAVLTSKGDGKAHFDITRTSLNNRETAWLVNNCYDANNVQVAGLKVDYAIIWGYTWSYSGIVDVTTGGTLCKAYTTTKPWLKKIPADPITYTP